MSTLAYFVAAALTGLLGLVVAGVVTAVCSDWLHVSTREGAAGYLVVYVALLGGVLGCALGVGAGRWVASRPEPSLLKALGVSAGAVLALGAAGLLIGWLNADFSVKNDSPSLEVGPSPDELRATEFAALPPDAPLAKWLPFLYESPSDARTKVVLQHIEAQQRELPALIGSKDATLRGYALGATKYPARPTPEVIEAVRAEGREIAEGLRKANPLPTDDPQLVPLLEELHARFREWSDAWWGLSQRLGLDSRPPVQEIYAITTKRARGTPAQDALTDDVRSLLEALNQEAQEKKL